MFFKLNWFILLSQRDLITHISYTLSEAWCHTNKEWIFTHGNKEFGYRRVTTVDATSWASADFFQVGGQEPTFCLKNNEKDTIFPKKV